MKKGIDSQAPVNVPRRFTGFGVLAVTVVFALSVFAIVGPWVEANAYLEALEDPQDRDRLERGLRTLCNTQPNIKLLNERLAEKPLSDRNIVTKAVEELGCLDSIEPTLLAEHYLWVSQSEDAVARATAQGDAAIEPAIAALEHGDERARHRAMSVFMALSGQLTRDHVLRIDKRLDEKDHSPETTALRITLKLEQPAPSKAPGEAEHPDAPHGGDASHDDHAHHEEPSAPPEPAAEDAEPVAEDAESAAEVEEPDADGAPGDDEQFELGGSGLRLNLDGLGIPTSAPAPEKKKPGLGQGGVLFRKGADE